MTVTCTTPSIQSGDFTALLSQKQFDIFSFTDVTHLGTEEKIAVAKALDIVLLEFLRSINYQHPQRLPDRELRDQLWAWADANVKSIPGCKLSVIETILEVSASLTEWYYPLAELDTRLHVAKLTTAVLSGDDGQTGNSGRSLNYFLYDILRGQKVQGQWQNMFADVVKDMVEHYGAMDPRIGAFAASDVVLWVEAQPTENHFAATLPPHYSLIPAGKKTNGCCPDGFASIFREWTGASSGWIAPIFKPSRDTEVPYEYWITSLANLKVFLNLGNDLFSVPKEILQNDAYNYMGLATISKRQANTPSRFTCADATHSVQGWTFRDTLCETMESIRDATLALDRAFVQFERYLLT
ncbi:hypothetical protein PT974_12140 [Cladobotryum mycophilum]|uniref:Uncharacterized protein n=1 Tax=Cladobotryum mycophilum TaxID=491253 RepID=A0ABR0S764_9HYPO